MCFWKESESRCSLGNAAFSVHQHDILDSRVVKLPFKLVSDKNNIENTDLDRQISFLQAHTVGCMLIQLSIIFKLG